MLPTPIFPRYAVSTMRGADLDSPLFLVDDVDDAHRAPVAFSDEHVLPSGELTDAVNAARDVRIKDTPRMGAVVSVVERSQCSNHEVRDETEVARPCWAHDDVAD